MEKMTLSQIKRIGTEVNAFIPGLEPVGYSLGIYGVNGVLLFDDQFGIYRCVTKRNSLLYRYL